MSFTLKYLFHLPFSGCILKVVNILEFFKVEHEQVLKQHSIDIFFNIASLFVKPLDENLF